jgi:hypothetical protein
MFARISAACDRSFEVLHQLEWLGPLGVRVVLG